MANNPFLNPDAVAAQGQQAAPPPATPESNPFDSAIETVLEQMRTDSVNSPVKPVAALNPFNDQLVSLGMALQGKSAEAIQLGSQVELQNKRRQDAYQNQLLQAENYRSLRKQRLATTLAGLQAQAGRSEMEDAFRTEQAAVSAQRFETTTEATAAHREVLTGQAQQRIDMERAKMDRTVSFTDFLTKKGNEQLYQGYLAASEQLSNYKRTGKIMVGGQPVDLSQMNLTAEQKNEMLTGFTDELYAVGDMMRRMGFVEEGMTWENELSAIVKDERATIEETSGFNVADPDAKPSGAAEVDALRRHRELLESAPATQFAVGGDANAFDDVLRFVDSSLVRTAETARLDDTMITADQQQQITIQGLSGRINEAVEADRTSFNTPEVKSDLKGLAIAEMRSLAGRVETLPNRATAIGIIRDKLMIEHGIPSSFVKDVERVLSKEYSQLFANQVSRTTNPPGTFGVTGKF